MHIFNARTQQEEPVVFSISSDSEIVATFKDGGFLKFPAGTDESALAELVSTHKQSNEGQEVITAEVLARREADQAFVDKLNGGTPEETTTDVTPEQPIEL